MYHKSFLPALAWVLVMVGGAQAQFYPTPPASESKELPPTDLPSQGLPPGDVHTPPVPSDWILNRKCETCCGPMGADGPIRTELYLESGASLPIGGGRIMGLLDPGWDIQGGARLMLFEPDMMSAWAVDISGTNIFNAARRTGHRFALSVLEPNQFGIVSRVNFGEGGLPGITLRDLNRTFVNLGVGRDWWLCGPAQCCGGNCNGSWNWRVGVDIGGRWGTDRARFEEIRQRTDVIGGVFVGFHSDIEIPCGCCVFLGGVRTEWSYTWSDILQQKSDVNEINLLFTLGVRY